MKESILKGKVVKIKNDIGIHELVRGEEYRVEDYWMNVGGGSWMDAKGNPACI